MDADTREGRVDKDEYQKARALLSEPQDGEGGTPEPNGREPHVCGALCAVFALPEGGMECETCHHICWTFARGFGPFVRGVSSEPMCPRCHQPIGERSPECSEATGHDVSARYREGLRAAAAEAGEPCTLNCHREKPDGSVVRLVRCSVCTNGGEWTPEQQEAPTLAPTSPPASPCGAKVGTGTAGCDLPFGHEGYHRIAPTSPPAEPTREENESA